MNRSSNTALPSRDEILSKLKKTTWKRFSSRTTEDIEDKERRQRDEPARAIITQHDEPPPDIEPQQNKPAHKGLGD